MAQKVPPRSLREIADSIGGTVEGDPETVITGVGSSSGCGPGSLTFAESDKHLAAAEESDAAAVLVAPSARSSSKPLVRVSNARAAFGQILAAYERRPSIAAGNHATATVHAQASVDASASIGPGAVIDEEATICPGARVHGLCFVGPGCHVGAGSELLPGAILLQDVRIGERCKIGPGCVLGASGFGYLWDGNRHVPVPQVGGVLLGDEVELGANVCIDRATTGDTIIESGVKLDNLVQVGHNVHIGKNSVVAGCTAIGGSVQIGEGVLIGGHATISDHKKIVSGARIAGRSGVMGDIDEPGEYFGLPALPSKAAMRALALQKRLPETEKRLREIEKRLDGLEK